jgi:major intracellular serine protease
MKRKNNTIGLLPYEREDIFGLTPKDRQFYGWEIKKFDIRQQWKYSQGEGVVVAVIDTGCDLDHEDLKTNIVQGKNFINSAEDPVDRVGHGTHVSGTIAAVNNGYGMVGVAPKTKIMPLKALNDDGFGSPEHIAKAVIWAADNKADFITMSLGSPNNMPSIKKAIDYANIKGSVVFCAAGNAGDHKPIMYPAQYDNVISIGAIDINLERTKFTCSGEELDFLAPGHDIVSAVPGNQYAMMSGTSMSNPFAVGCASLLLSYRRTRNLSIPKTYQDYIHIFQNSATPLKNPKYRGKKQYEGYGIINPVWF